ncbi:hypothetical protein EJ08DRAFT_704512 [Tothia fuscella]|uniref:Fork-head domain-containing protein n=1 Tax=Tothia fuscella TaxID=1048955 RepID=A0A9P4U3K5_9PEZI|nr:hypothetical protein EJ08DRAFT_704512 [Tothia fuscella]
METLNESTMAPTIEADAMIAELGHSKLLDDQEKHDEQPTASQSDQPTPETMASPSAEAPETITAPEPTPDIEPGTGDPSDLPDCSDGHELVFAPTSAIFTYPLLRDDGQKPTLTLPQLVIMALVMAPSRILSLSNICDWISRSFHYHREQAPERSQQDGGSPTDWHSRVDSILHRYDFPTNPIYDENNGEFTFELKNGREWFVLPKPEVPFTRPFRLMDVPIEFRLKIYKFALCHPLPVNHGWALDAANIEEGKAQLDNSDWRSQFLTTKGVAGFELRTRRIDEVLALLLVNKQVHAEATPVFYRSNYFYFDSAQTLITFLSGIPSRLQFVRNIVFKYDPQRLEDRSYHAAFKLLAQTKIRNLHIIIKERELIQNLLQYGEVCTLPGIATLGKLRGISSVSFEGNFICLARYLYKKNIRGNKPGDEADDDEQAEAKLEADRKAITKDILKARKALRKQRKQEEKEALKNETQAQREERKRLKAENKAARLEQKKLTTEEKKLKRAEHKQRVREVKAAEAAKKKQRRKADTAKAKAAKARHSASAKISEAAAKSALKSKKKAPTRGGVGKIRKGMWLPGQSEHESSSEESSSSDSDSDLDIDAPSKATNAGPSLKQKGKPAVSAPAKRKRPAAKRSQLIMVGGKAVPIDISSDHSTTTSDDSSSTSADESDSKQVPVKKVKTGVQKVKELVTMNASFKAQLGSSMLKPKGKVQGADTAAKGKVPKKCSGEGTKRKRQTTSTSAPLTSRGTEEDEFKI